jgi:hypothetical protein
LGQLIADGARPGASQGVEGQAGRVAIGIVSLDRPVDALEAPEAGQCPAAVITLDCEELVDDLALLVGRQQALKRRRSFEDPEAVVEALLGEPARR